MYVDLDGTLIRTDLLYEAVMCLAKQAPWLCLLLPFWLLRGKAYMKQRIAERVMPAIELLPYNEALLDYLKQAKASGRRIYLATASHKRYAEAVAEHLGLFDGVLATDGKNNLSGKRKLAAIIEREGERGFVYAGNGRVDLAIWRHAAGAIVVDAPAAVNREAARLTTIEQRFSFADRPLPLAIIKAIRVHQWVKNVLIFVPILAAHRFSEAALFQQALLAFFSFSLCASSVYLLNDMLDLASDRRHPRKCKRPFASGDLHLKYGMAGVPLLLGASLALALILPGEFLLVLVTYYALTLAYSFHLKSEPVIDIIMLALLYTIRIIAGSAASGIELSFWLLAFSVFIFLSLALVKRYSELHTMILQQKRKASGRGYATDDIGVLLALGSASGLLSILVLALYLNSETVATLYSHPYFIWLINLLLLYWISRIWLLTHRGQMHDDPVVFAVKDKTSAAIAILMGICIWLAI
ncbi:MAG: UbiA family prenyltransferase [Zetaproteobacteria bacterium]|nr:MAG: UbiA family prenyltransferase [Zetaproteobacteria bacterium]